MNNNFQELLYNWPRGVIKDTDLGIVFLNRPDARYSAVKRALQKKTLTRIRRGLYLIGKPYTKDPINHYEIAQMVYAPSYISLESALSYHQWIPEAVYTTTSATAKRAKTFKTPIGVFRYSHVPAKGFYQGIKRIKTKNSAFLMAEPWKALADYCYVHHKQWKTPKDLELDMRIEIDSLLESNRETLHTLAKNYPSKRVRTFLEHMIEELD